MHQPTWLVLEGAGNHGEREAEAEERAQKHHHDVVDGRDPPVVGVLVQVHVVDPALEGGGDEDGEQGLPDVVVALGVGVREWVGGGGVSFGREREVGPRHTHTRAHARIHTHTP